MTLKPLFLYGTLRDDDIRAAALGRHIAWAELVPASAHDHIAVYYPQRVYPALIPQSGGAAPGLLLTEASESDLACLDAFEGAEYRRAVISVMAGGRAITAEAYLPSVEIARDSPIWTLEAWTSRHKPAVIADETASAVTIRRRLSGQS